MHEDYIETKIRDFRKSESGLPHFTVRSYEEFLTRRGSKKEDFHDQLHLLTV